MQEILIRTAGVTAKNVSEYLERSCKIIGYVDKNLEKWKKTVDGKRCYSVYEALTLCNRSDVKIVIPDKFYELKEELQNIGIRDEQILIFWEEGYSQGKQYLFTIDEFTCLPYLEMHVIDNCNYACKNCSAFAPLVKQKTRYEFDVFQKDLLRCKELFPYIKQYRFLGGEPLLLGDELAKYIELVRKIYPYTDIRIATNGSLIPRLSRELIQVINENHVAMDITVYPVTYSTIDEIAGYAIEQGMKIHLDNRNSFIPVLNKEKKKYPFDSVKGCICTVIKDGCIAKCVSQFYIKYYNQAFGTNLPEVPGIDLYEEFDGKKILERLEIPFALCDYCNLYKVWHHCDSNEECQQLIRENIKKEDWN